MKVSILIPCFNAAQTLESTLRSCICQGEDVVEEIIVVDDHSSDDSKSIFDQIAHDHPSFHWMWATNPSKGACSARNHAFRLSQGAFIQWLDADDILGPGKLRHQLQLISDSQNCIVACPFRCFAGSPETGLIDDLRVWELPTESEPAWWVAADTMIGSHCWLTPRNILTSAGSWDESLNINQDGEYFARVVASAKRVLFDDQVEVYYRREGGGVSKFCAEKADSLFRSIESMANTALQIEDSNRMRQMISNRWQHFIYTAYPHAPELRRQAEALLKELPTPTLPNPQTVSRASQLFSRLFGWKTLMHIRQWRGHV